MEIQVCKQALSNLRKTETHSVILRQVLPLWNQSPRPQLPPLYNRKSRHCEKQAAIQTDSCWFSESWTYSSLVALTGALTQNKTRLDPKTKPSNLNHSKLLLCWRRRLSAWHFWETDSYIRVYRAHYADIRFEAVQWASIFLCSGWEKWNLTCNRKRLAAASSAMTIPNKVKWYLKWYLPHKSRE